jgi:hypothetical protein
MTWAPAVAKMFGSPASISRYHTRLVEPSVTLIPSSVREPSSHAFSVEGGSNPLRIELAEGKSAWMSGSPPGRKRDWSRYAPGADEDEQPACHPDAAAARIRRMTVRHRLGIVE